MTDSVRLQRHAAVPANPPGDGKPVRLLGWISAVGIGGAILLMAGASFVRQDWMVPEVQVPAVGPPFELHQHISGRLVATGLWVAVVLAVVGLVAGLVAARRGARGPIRLILIGGALAVLALMLAPPVGSTDALDYASYGRLALLGHNPYVASPIYLRITDPIFGQSVPVRWEHQVSLYGPAATLEQYVAAKLGGESIARVVFWLKMWNALAFGAVAFVLDRVLRRNPAARLRGHLLWTVNPLLLWGLMAAGHIDVVAAAAGILGLLAVGRQPAGVQPKIWRAVVAGALVGLAVAFKIDFAVFGLGLAWALRRSVPALLAAVAGALAILGPTYAALGTPAIKALSSARGLTSQDSFWRAAHLTNSKYLIYLALLAFIGMAALLLWRMPPGDRLRPAIRPALAISVAFVFMWPYQLPWYDTMIICVLVLFPASRLDWLVVGRLGVSTLANMPGNPDGVTATALGRMDVVLVHRITPALLLTAVGLLVLLAVSGRWGVVQQDGRTSSVPSSGKTPQIGRLSYLLRSGQHRTEGPGARWHYRSSG